MYEAVSVYRVVFAASVLSGEAARGYAVLLDTLGRRVIELEARDEEREDELRELAARVGWLEERR